MLGGNNYISIGLFKGGTFVNEENIFKSNIGGIVPPEPSFGFVLSPPSLKIISRWYRHSTWKANDVWYR